MNSLLDDEWKEVFAKQEISLVNQREIITAKSFDRSRIYYSILDRRELRAAEEAIHDMRRYLRKFGVFIPKEIGDEMEALALKVQAMITINSMGPSHDLKQPASDFQKFVDEVEPRYVELGEVVRREFATIGKMSSTTP
ncbi:hypothetical protein [Pandoraea eparura]|uniref:hypothetical protein n=1 Tax=Pandoraea eparura TaxID=2508291 RepID=UPI0012425D40|nr:hypothetical protein [Pandoraea eparura]